MKLIEFPEQTVVIAKDQPQYRPLPAHRFADDPEGRIACCCQLTWREAVSCPIWRHDLASNPDLRQVLATAIADCRETGNGRAGAPRRGAQVSLQCVADYCATTQPTAEEVEALIARWQPYCEHADKEKAAMAKVIVGLLRSLAAVPQREFHERPCECCGQLIPKDTDDIKAWSERMGNVLAATPSDYAPQHPPAPLSVPSDAPLLRKLLQTHENCIASECVYKEAASRIEEAMERIELLETCVRAADMAKALLDKASPNSNLFVEYDAARARLAAT